MNDYLQPEFVDFIPEHLAQGVIYISKRYSTASHLCCCGCGLKVVTPLNPAKWQLIEKNRKISLYPSIGNWSFPCKSHYWLSGNEVHWAEEMSPQQIAFIKELDRIDAEILTSKPEQLSFRIWQKLTNFLKSLLKY